MVAVTKLRPGLHASSASKTRSSGPLRFLNGSFSPRKIARQYPVIAGLHKVADGALVGVLIAVSLMSAFSLHWRHMWTVAYYQLDLSRQLTHELSESTAMLERYILKGTNIPSSMVRTKASNLLYLDKDVTITYRRKDEKSRLSRFLSNFDSRKVSHGY